MMVATACDSGQCLTVFSEQALCTASWLELSLGLWWQVRREHEDVRKRRLDEFMAGFNCISLRLKEMYQMITLGGDAELELVDSLDPFSEVHCPSRCTALDPLT